MPVYSTGCPLDLLSEGEYNYYIENIFKEITNESEFSYVTEETTTRMDDLDPEKIHIFTYFTQDKNDFNSDRNKVMVYWNKFKNLGFLEAHYCIQKALEKYSKWFEINRCTILPCIDLTELPDICNGKPHVPDLWVDPSASPKVIS